MYGSLVLHVKYTVNVCVGHRFGSYVIHLVLGSSSMILSEEKSFWLLLHPLATLEHMLFSPLMFCVARFSLQMSQVAHQAGAYLGFCSMKQLGIFLLPPGWVVSPLQGYPSA